MSIVRNLAIYLLLLTGVSVYADGVPEDCTQLILGIAPTWNSMRGDLRLFERSHGGDWKLVAGPFPALFGKSGLAWGTGLAGQDEPGLRKKGRDRPARARILAIRKEFREAKHRRAGAENPNHKATDAVQ